MNDLLQENRKLREKLETVKAELQNKAQRMAKLQSDSDSAQKLYEELLSRVVELQQKEEQLITMNNENETLKKTNTRLISTLQQKEKQISERDIEIRELKSKLSNSDYKLNEQLTKNEEQNQRIIESNQLIKSQQLDLENIQKSLANIQKDFAAQKEVNDQLFNRNQDLEKINDNYRLQSNSFQFFSDKAKADISEKSKEIEVLQTKCRQWESLVKNSTYLLTNHNDDIDSSTFLKILGDKVSKPKYSNISTQSENNDNDSLSFSEAEVFPKIKKISSRRLTSDVLEQFNREKERERERDKEKEIELERARDIKSKAAAAKKIGQIKDQFQNDLSLERIIQMHNRLWQEENQQINSLVKKNQKMI